jgi:hypothetical protein
MFFSSVYLFFRLTDLQDGRTFFADEFCGIISALPDLTATVSICEAVCGYLLSQEVTAILQLKSYEVKGGT